MHYSKRLEYIEKHLLNYVSISKINSIRKIVQEYIDGKEIEMTNPFERDKIMILSYLRLLRKRNVYLKNRHCNRYKLFAQKNSVPFDEILWRELAHIPNNQSDFLSLLGLWRQQVSWLEKLWNESINQLLLALYRKLLERLNDECEIHSFEQLMDCLKDLDFHYEQELSLSLEENDIRLFSLTDIPLDKDELFNLFDSWEIDISSKIDLDFLEGILIEKNISEKCFSKGASRRELTLKDKRLFLSWDKKISKDKNIRQLLNLLGKGMRISNTAKSNSNMFGELSGLKLGKDIQTALPLELAQIAIPELSCLFDLKYIEEKLLSFELNSPFFQEKCNVSSKQGAMILCLDTSGSMTYADRENIAKAVTYYLSSQAISQKRHCFIINFSVNIHTFNVRKEPRKLADFLSNSFNGGTDIEPALDESLRVLKGNQYKNADVLVISDLQFLDIKNELKIDIENEQKRGTKFNVLVVGEKNFLSRNIPFNHIWSIDDNAVVRIIKG